MKNKSFVRGAPKLDRFQLHVFKDSAAVKQSFLRQEINAGIDLNSAELKEVADKRQDALIYKTLVSDGMFAFLKNDSPLFADTTVRKAFVALVPTGSDSQTFAWICDPDGWSTHFNQLPSGLQKRQAEYNVDQAKAMLDQAGWTSKMVNALKTVVL